MSKDELITQIQGIFDRYEDALPTLGSRQMVEMIREDIISTIREDE